MAINEDAIKKLNNLKSKWIYDFPSIKLSYGDTPTSLICNDFKGIDELRPGNFVFFDMQQASKGVCSISSIAIALACPVVAVYPNRCMAIIWGGAVHLSKDYYADVTTGQQSFGAVCLLNEDCSVSDPIEGLFLESVSQEHGVIKAHNCEAIKNLYEGQLVAILPAHSCLAADATKNIWIKKST